MMTSASCHVDMYEANTHGREVWMTRVLEEAKTRPTSGSEAIRRER